MTSCPQVHRPLFKGADAHAHPAIHRTVLAYFREKAIADGTACVPCDPSPFHRHRPDMARIVGRVLEVTARVLANDNGRPFWSQNGVASVRVSDAADRVLNAYVTAAKSRSSHYVAIQNMIAIKVVELCRRGNTLDSALRHLEQSSSPLP